MAYRDFKDLPRRTASDKVLYGKVFNIAKNSNYNKDQRGVASTVYKFFDKKASSIYKGPGTNSKSKELAEKLHKPIIRKFVKRKVYSPVIDNIWGSDLANMQLISKFNKGFRFLLCVVISIYNE